jgi:hypothetical protein
MSERKTPPTPGRWNAIATDRPSKPAPPTFEFDLARRNVLAFADIAGWPMTRWQAKALTLKARITVIVAPRQSGKSRSLAIKATQWAFRKPGQHVLIISAGEDAARRLLGEVKRLIADGSVLSASVVDEMAGLITLSNGSMIRSVPASERQIRGWTVDLLLVDEAALVSDDLLLGAALPTTAARPNARVVLASSATVASGAFYDHVRMAEAGSEHIALHRWALTDCPWISTEVIEAARESMSEMRFRAEYEGVFASGADALFSPESLERATSEYWTDELAAMEGPARVAAGVDWGATIDRSAICAIGRVADTGMWAVRCVHRWPAGEPLHDVIAAIAGSPTLFDTLAMETNGLGMPCAQELSRLIQRRSRERGGGQRRQVKLLLPRELEDEIERRKRAALRHAIQGRPEPFATRRVLIHTTGEMKAAAYSTLRLLLDQRRLLLPASAEDLRRELLMLRVDLTPGGSERIEASVGHDDLADALMLALCPYRNKRGRWITYIGQLAQAIDADEGDIGRQPVWQSVNGPERSQLPQDGIAPLNDRQRDRGERLRARIEGETKGGT